MVEQLWRYLVKSAQGESLASLTFDSAGPRLDRSWACVDADGIVVSAKHPRRWGRLLQVCAWSPDGEHVLLQAPDGPTVIAGSPEADEELSHWLGAAVTLSRTVPEQPRLHRLFPREAGMRPSWATDRPEDTVTAMAGRDRFVDFGGVHIVTLADMDEVPDADVRRFRPNLVLSLPTLATGDRVELSGGVTLEVTLPTPRCAIPGLAQPGLDASSDLLRAVGRRRQDIPGFGTAACLGVYAEVVRPGVVTYGELAVVA